MQFVWAIALLIISYALQALLTPKAEEQKPSTLGDFNVPTTDEGTPQSVIFGDCWTDDWTVLWYGDFDVRAISAKGKK